MFRLFKSDFFNFETLRLLSFTPYEGGEIAEILEAIGEIKDNDVESWYSAWMKAGTKAEAVAEQAELAGNRNAARRAYFSASNYQRAAQFMLNGRNPNKDSRILSASETAISNFRRATLLMDAKVQCLEIPYEKGVNLPAYLYLPHPSKQLPGKMPFILNTVGGDATQEEIFNIFPRDALELGYAVLTFEGPGQGIVLRRDQLPMRPDWEFVISAVLDFAFEFAKDHPELQLDMDRLAISGSSVGGYLSLRGALDPRVKACIAVDPFYCMWDLVKGRMPDFFINTFEAGGFASDEAWDYLVDFLSWVNVQTRWEFNHLRWMLGVQSAADVFRKMQEFTFSREDGVDVLHSVHCPVMVTGAGYSMYAKPEISTTRIYNCLSHLDENQRLQWIATEPGDGGLQSKVGAFGALTRRSFEWLDKLLEIDRKIPLNF
ncbi:uncharacterized protein K452DRAFT_303087 [Aplosporella prunicola CBS 121167]|uniref:AB hydrolase-1 domain-containing protein n=1 Tax=Aplosporella prunicola CBS 121167 TaxID=1176127 RepID=A0A6A6AVU0_9PEZI|nr:uncharacterized protein K452DRAFT_303087 [Aplosporella prunicola CBS 121167]KAF2136069.1 hypothetical protein K452DRAFT_303087 [Aplosporella prunicola CBS 121167]